MIVWVQLDWRYSPSRTLDLGIKGATRMGGYPGLAADYYLAVKSIQIPVDPGLGIHNLQLRGEL